MDKDVAFFFQYQIIELKDMSTILITGGTGLIGTALTQYLLEKKYRVIIVTRYPGRFTGKENLGYAAWDVDKGIIDPAAISAADHIIHLAGAGVADKRWTPKRKEEIRNSRVNSGNLICKVLNELPNNVRTVVSASAIGWYGPDPVIPNPDPFTEEDAAATDFLGTTCLEWERSVHPVTGLGKKLVILRTGVVLSTRGGAFPSFRKPLKFGFATILSKGNQVLSWIHINDLVRLYVAAVEEVNIEGIYNAVAPNPVSNKTLTLELAKKTNGKSFLPIHVPAPLLKLVLGEMSVEVLKSATVSSAKIKQTGFQFAFPSIKSAIAQLA
jgi:uncharacterized protein (TIGR01777 family)